MLHTGKVNWVTRTAEITTVLPSCLAEFLTRWKSQLWSLNLSKQANCWGELRKSAQQLKTLSGAWEERELYCHIYFHGPYGNSVVSAEDTLDGGDPNDRVCMLNGKHSWEGRHPDPKHMGLHFEREFCTNRAMLPAYPWDIDLLMNCSIDLHPCLHHQRTQNKTLSFSFFIPPWSPQRARSGSEEVCVCVFFLF